MISQTALSDLLWELAWLKIVDLRAETDLLWPQYLIFPYKALQVYFRLKLRPKDLTTVMVYAHPFEIVDAF